MNALFTPTPVTGHIVAAAKAGLPGQLLIPCSPHSERPSEWNHSPGKTPCRLTVHGEWGPIKDWRRAGAIPDADLLRYSQKGANCGLILGVPFKEWQYLFLDIDTEPGIEEGSRDWKIADAISTKALAALQASLGMSALWVRLTRPGRAGVLLRLPAAADAGRKAVLKMSTGAEKTNRGKIELLTNGQQAVVAGLHVFKNGTPIRWYRTDAPTVFDRVPAMDEAIPVLESRAQMDAAVESVMEVLKASGITFSGKSLSHSPAENDRPVDDLHMMPPSIDMLVDLLDAMPRDKRTLRDEWVKTMRNVAGCGAALERAGKLSDADRVRIEEAAIQWSTRWTEGVFTEQESREKWEIDFARSPNTEIPCWSLLVDRAISLGDQSLQGESLRLRADEIDADFTPTEVAPAGFTGSPDPSKAVWPQGFRMTNDGLVYQPKNSSAPTRLAAPFEIVAEVRSPDGDSHALWLEWTDADGKPRELHLQRRLVHADGSKIAELLEDRGLSCAPGRTEHAQLATAFAGVRAPRRRVAVDRPGWHGTGSGQVYVHPAGAVYGPGAEGIILKRPAGSVFESSRNLDEWKDRVARFAVGNSRLGLFMAAAFTGPLLKIMNEPSGGLHLVGDSRCGKTTAAALGGSVWGPPEGGQVRSWRLTDNGLEAIAAETSDSLLILDELGQADARIVGDVVYMISNGTGKIRAQHDASLRRIKHWSAFFLSTGESTLAEKMATAGKPAPQGLAVRLANVLGDSGAGHGVYETLHGHASGGALSDYLRHAAAQFNGTASHAFLARLVKDRAADSDALRVRLAEVRDAFVATHVPASANGQVRSVAARFGLVAAAGELATDYEVLPWPTGEATRAAARCFAAWLTARGGTGAGEEAAMLKQIRVFLTLHGESRFTRLTAGGRTAAGVAPDGADDPPHLLAEIDADGDRVTDKLSKTIMRVGYRRDGRAIEPRTGEPADDEAADTREAADFLIWPSTWESELCRGFDGKRAAKLLYSLGFLTAKEQGHLTNKERVDGKRERFYVVSGRIMEED